MLKKLTARFAQLHSDQAGAMSVEKILILACIALPLLIVLYIFRTKITGWFQNQSNSLEQSQNP